MSSTRNLNHKLNYIQEINENKKYNKNIFFNPYLKPSHCTLGTMPSFKGNEIVDNRIDVESMLYGIRSTNLEGSNFKTTPNNNTLSETSFFYKNPVVYESKFFSLNKERPTF